MQKTTAEYKKKESSDFATLKPWLLQRMLHCGQQFLTVRTQVFLYPIKNKSQVNPSTVHFFVFLVILEHSVEQQ